MLTGSLAAAYYSNPRATQDPNLVIEPTIEQIDALVRSLLDEGVYVSRAQPAGAPPPARPGPQLA